LQVWQTLGVEQSWQSLMLHGTQEEEFPAVFRVNPDKQVLHKLLKTQLLQFPTAHDCAMQLLF
jgi:hypothetical protein